MKSLDRGLSHVVVIGGAVPMLFVSYTAAPFVNQVSLFLPSFAQRSREHMLAYLNSIPRTATLSIETMKFNFYPRRTQLSISDLRLAKAITRPVSFENTNPQTLPWWKGKDKIYFFTSEKSRPAKATSKFYPEVWEHVFAHIKNNRSCMKTT